MAFWIPSGQRWQILFNLLDIKDLALLASQPVYSHFFSPVLLAHYIIPAYRKIRPIPEIIKQLIEELESSTNFLAPWVFQLKSALMITYEQNAAADPPPHVQYCIEFFDTLLGIANVFHKILNYPPHGVKITPSSALKTAFIWALILEAWLK